MTKQTPSSIALPALGEMAPGKPVFKSTWQTLIGAQHYAYGRQGAHILNLTFEPYWESLDYGSGGSAYHSVGTSSTPGIIELNQHSAIFQFERHLHLSGAADQGFYLVMNAYARNLDIRLTCQRFDTEDGHSGSSTNVHTLTSSHSATDSEWQLNAQEFTHAEASRSGSTVNGLAYFLVYVEAKVPASGSGYLHQLDLSEIPITAGTSLPRGPLP